MKLKLLFLTALFSLAFMGNISSQTLGCSTAGVQFVNGSNVPISPTISCNQGFAYCTYTPVFSYNGVGTATGSAGPCLRLVTSLTPTNAVNSLSINLIEGGVSQGAMCSNTPVPCFASVPNSLPFLLYNTNLDPTLTHSFVLCHTVATTPDITYTVFSCYNNVPITQGTWTVTTGPGCQTVGIPANTPIGTSQFTVTPAIPSFTNYGDGYAGFNPATTTPGTYTVDYTFIANGTCTTTATRTLIITNPYDPSWTPIGPFCSTVNCVALNPQITGTVGGTWTGAGVVTNSFCPGTVGAGTSTVTYSVGITATCGSANTKTITVNQTPTLSAGPSRTLTCLVTSTTLIGSGGTTYTWTGPGAFSSNLASPTITLPGTYTLYVTSAAGCASSVAAIVVVSQVTVAPVATIINGSITCTSGGTGTLGVIPNTGMTYTWSGAGITSGSNTANPVVNATGTYTLNYTDLSTGCSSVTVGSVVFNTLAPTGNAITSGSINCVTPSVSISHSNATYNYTWTAPGTGTIVAGVNSQSASVTGTGVFTVFVTTPGGCPGSFTTSVTGNLTLPTATVAPSTTLSLGCTGPTNTIVLTVGSTPTGLNYNWSNGSTLTSVAVSSAGLYTVLVTDPANSCTTSAQYSVTQAQNPTGVNAGADNLLPCDTASTYNLFGSSSLANGTFSWTGGGIKSGANTATVSIVQPGVYVLTVTDPNSGCFARDTVLVGVSSIVASFTANPLFGNSPLTVDLTNGSIGATSYTWALGNGSTATYTNGSTTYTTGGTYTIILTASSGYCSDTASAIIVVSDNLTLEIPNVFTPNGDGINDVFVILSSGCKELNLEIYNRWGNLMYVFTGPKAAWDGIASDGHLVPAGTYFYIVKATGSDPANPIEKHGYISIFR